MQSSLISKIEKARRYAQEPERVGFVRFEATFQGEHDLYTVTYDEGKWHCTCSFFPGWDTCSHTMAIQRIMGDHLPKLADIREPVAHDSN